MKTWMRAAALVVAMGLVGCGMQSGKTVVKRESGMQPVETEVMQAGSYALFDSYDTTPQVTVPLDRGDTIGFRDEGGKTVAVAGGKTYQLNKSDRTYYWKRQ